MAGQGAARERNEGGPRSRRRGRHELLSATVCCLCAPALSVAHQEAEGRSGAMLLDEAGGGLVWRVGGSECMSLQGVLDCRRMSLLLRTVPARQVMSLDVR